MISLERWKASSYINCLKKYFNDEVTVSSMAFLLVAKDNEKLDLFKPDTKGVIYIGDLEDIEDDCHEWVKLFSVYNAEVINETALKLWRYYAGEQIKFNEKEKELLDSLGIKI